MTQPDSAYLVVDQASGDIVQASDAAARRYGYPPSRLKGMPLDVLWPDARLALSDPAAAQAAVLARHRRSDGHPFDARVEMTPLARPERPLLRLRISEVTARAFSLALMESEARLLQRIARGGALRQILADLVAAIERLSSGMVGSVLLLTDDGQRVRHGAAPHLPPPYWTALEGARIGPTAGSCGTAIYTAKQVIVADIARDSRWRDYRALALKHGLRACWSTPILSRRKQVLGAFALYYRDVRRPAQRELRLVEVASDLAAIAIERELADRLQEAGASSPPRRQPSALSAREAEVLRLIARGDPVKQIAAALELRPSTVYAHRARLLQKLGARSDVELARHAVAHGLI